MTRPLTFSLDSPHVPEPPRTDGVADRARWLVMVMDMLDPDLQFAAGVLSYVLKEGDATGKQWARLQHIYERVVYAYGVGALLCQCYPEGGRFAQRDADEDQ